MSGPVGYHHRGIVIGARICKLLQSLGPSTYDEISPQIKYWIEYALTEQSVNADDLVEQLSFVAWGNCSSGADAARFLKEFRDAPHRSEQARSIVDRLCEHVLRWFAAASAEDLKVWYWEDANRVAMSGGRGFACAASFVGYLIEWGLLNHEVVRRHLVKPLIALHYTDRDDVERSFRAVAIYQLFVAAGNTLLQGLLEPEDVQACFKALDATAGISPPSGTGLSKPGAKKIKVQCSICLGASHLNLLANLFWLVTRNSARSILHG